MASEYSYYAYTVNNGASVFFIVLFLLFAIIEIYFSFITHQRYKDRIDYTKARRFIVVMIPLTTAMFMEAAGYICRMLSHTKMDQMGPFIVQSMTILIAPSFIQASIYMLFGEILKALKAEHHCLIKLSYFTKIFVVGDVISILIQSAGGGMSVTNPKLGNGLATTGLFIQIAFFSTFMTCMIHFMFKIRTQATLVSESLKRTHAKYGNWKHCLFVLFVASILILIRSIYKIIEFIQGAHGELQTSEIYFFFLDSMMISLAMLNFSSFNYTRFLAKVELTHGHSFKPQPSEELILNEY